MKPIKNFTDLDAWQKAHELRVMIIKLLPEFPQGYQYGLCAQLQRSSISVASNIAEGFGRSTNKEKLNFYNYAKGSLTEVQDQLILCADLKLISKNVFLDLTERSINVHKLINGLTRYLRATSNEKRDTK
jgi:four helix bundle protein